VTGVPQAAGQRRLTAAQRCPASPPSSPPGSTATAPGKRGEETGVVEHGGAAPMDGLGRSRPGRARPRRHVVGERRVVHGSLRVLAPCWLMAWPLGRGDNLAETGGDPTDSPDPTRGGLGVSRKDVGQPAGSARRGRAGQPFVVSQLTRLGEVITHDTRARPDEVARSGTRRLAPRETSGSSRAIRRVSPPRGSLLRSSPPRGAHLRSRPLVTLSKAGWCGDGRWYLGRGARITVS